MRMILTSIAAGSLLAAVAVAQTPRYTVTDLGTMSGGTYSQPVFINNRGLISGWATRHGGVQHAVLSQGALMMDIGIAGLGGPNSMAFGNNIWGQVVGTAETPASDSENFCGFGSGNACAAFVWQYGVMTQLPTLGGANSQAVRINSQGVMTGYAENQTPDLACPPPQKFQFKPVIWDQGKIQELPTVSGDPEGVTHWINDNGQVVGASGVCSAYNSNLGLQIQGLHALLWQNGTVTDLGNLGGTGHGFGILASGINNAGQVVGFSDMPGDTSFQAFLWTKDKGIHGLGTLPGDVSSLAISIGDSGDVTGISLDPAFNPRAFLWQNGVMTDLNAVIPADGSLFLLTACSVNSSGQIIGFAVRKDTGDLHGYLLTPRRGLTANASLSPAAQEAANPAALPESIRQIVRQRMPFGRVGAEPR